MDTPDSTDACGKAQILWKGTKETKVVKDMILQGTRKHIPPQKRPGKSSTQRVPRLGSGIRNSCQDVTHRMHGTAVFTCNFITKMDHSLIGKLYTSPHGSHG